MNSLTHIVDNHQRLTVAKKNRSDAINQAITERDRQLKALRAELRLARCCMGLVCMALMMATAYQIWRMG